MCNSKISYTFATNKLSFIFQILACTIRYLWLVLVPLFFSTCITTRDCPIETLQPADLTFKGAKKSIALCAPQTLFGEAIMSNARTVGVPSDSLIANILYSLKHVWENAPGYGDTQFHIFITETDELFDASKFDMVVQLAKLQVKNSYYGQSYSYFEWEAYLYVQYAARWLVYSKSEMTFDDYTDHDLIVWPSGIRLGKNEAVMELPDIKDAWWDMGIAMAKNYVSRIVPQWQKGIRRIYMINKFPELSQQAYTAMQRNGYGRAYDIWENMLLSCRKRGQKKLKSQITYNMAVACEFQNQLDEAIHWVQQSANYSRKSRIADYLKLLKERQKQREQLDQQTTL